MRPRLRSRRPSSRSSISPVLSAGSRHRAAARLFARLAEDGSRFPKAFWAGVLLVAAFSGPGAARATDPGREAGVVVVPGASGSGVVVQGRVPRSPGGGSPVIWYSVYDTYPMGPPEKRSPTQGLEVKPAGRLRLVVEPADAQVWVDGHPLPSGADVSVGLLTGSYTVQAAREGYRSQTRQVAIEAAKTSHLTIRLERQAE